MKNATILDPADTLAMAKRENTRRFFRRLPSIPVHPAAREMAAREEAEHFALFVQAAERQAAARSFGN